ncbi:suppressor of fused domain protein [Persicirhabdus sediminis]|uniref:Suppressor of fused domain protein n=1 Tax=Persicirhabdus sediminis TaxID=454144 RepID=A0A8J7SH66_9BACT|nr:suppressor of fused domain protein [Persicirhabdus sediminis]MBK1789629.1 suppressor of fused domain protein [Persicirhabdus sediminis]
MREADEFTESGQPVYHYNEAPKEFEVAQGDEENIELISQHIEKHIGPVANVFHELISDAVHIDIHIVEPSAERNFYTLVTSGMSDKAMETPEQCADCQYTELMICLPADWPMSQEEWKDTANYWPVHMLKSIARFPHLYNSWVWAMHTIPNGDPPVPFAENTQMSAILLAPPVTLPADFYQLKVDDEKTIHFHCLIPLHNDELVKKLKKGGESLFDDFDRCGVNEVLDAGRPSSIGPQKPWYAFWK